MKFSRILHTLQILGLCILCASFSHTMQAAPIGTLISPQHVFAPFGFDSNDHSEILIAANLPNLCYKAPQGTATLNGKRIEIQLSALFSGGLNTLCPMMIVPVLEAVPVGLLATGTYKVSVNGMLSPNTTLIISEPTSTNVDDHIYAGVTSVEIVDRKNVVLRGVNPSRCLVLDQIRSVSNGSDAYSILPIMRRTSDDCPRSFEPFTYPFSVPQTLKSDEILLHVRSLNGRSVNVMIDNTIAR